MTLICPDCFVTVGKPLIPIFLDIAYRRCDRCQAVKFPGAKLREIKPGLCANCNETKPYRGSSLCGSCRYFVRRKNQRREYAKRPEVRARLREYKASRKCLGSILSKRISATMRYALKKKKSGRSWESLTGYTVKDLKAHLEKQFKPGMSWENMELWHIDHIVPIAAFRKRGALYEELKICWGLANLRPIWAQENNRKYSKMEFLL